MPSTDLSATACSSSSFSAPHIFGTSILTLTASQVTNFSLSIPAAYWANHPALEVKSTSFCNVTVTYTHPKQNDKITVTAWLPDHDTWNERLLATGGGGYAAGGSYILSYYALAGSMATGYASITTNAGISETGYATDWALLSPGNIDLNALNNLGSVSLREQALIGKSLVRRYYGREEKYSYFTGCSQGGRQGLALAQRFPDLYDGIAASAPAINWSKVMLTMLWPHLIMNLAKEYPHSCELDHLTSLTIAACDGLDGVVDGLVTELESCKFDPFTAVGTKFFCAATNKTMKVSRIAAEVADATWKGPKTIDGKALWYGPGRGADLGGGITTEGIAETICDANSKCISAPFEFGLEWAKLFIEKNPDFDTRNITHKQYAEMFHIGEQQFHDFLGTDDPDLSAFRASGGKMLTYHGMVRIAVKSQNLS